MTKRSQALTVTAVILVLAAAHALFVYPKLPDPMASHFGAGGQADGYQAKSSFFVLYAVLMGSMAAIFAGLAVVMPKIPASMINLPNKDYYLAPERREKTLDEISTSMVWMGNVTLAFIGWVMHLTFQANLDDGEPSLGWGFGISLVAYLVYTMVWCVGFIWRYRARAEKDT